MKSGSFFSSSRCMCVWSVCRRSYRRWKRVRSPSHKLASAVQHLVVSTPNQTSYVTVLTAVSSPCYLLTHTHARTHSHPFNGPLPGLPGWTGTREVKPIWILLKQETVNGSGISWAICKSAPCSRQITTPAPHYSVFIDWMPFLPPNQQRHLLT